MHCMEVWGGNRAVDTDVVLAGLDAWVFSRPFRGHHEGGDVHYVSSCATGKITRALVADVAGHGTEVAATALVLRDLMRRYVNRREQNHFIEVLNRKLTPDDDSGRFATAIAATFYAPTRMLSVCNAGHPPPLWYRAEEDRWCLVDRTEPGSDQQPNIPLGVVPATTFVERDIPLQVGDLVLCYTDALTERQSRVDGPDGLLALMPSLDPSKPESLLRELLRRVEDPDAPLEDDVTLLLLRPNGSAASMSWRDRLLLPLRIVREMASSALPRERSALSSGQGQRLR